MTDADLNTQELSGQIWCVLLSPDTDPEERLSLLNLIERIAGVTSRLNVEATIRRLTKFEL